MLTVGITELRRHLSRYVGRVKAGESIEITERGEPIAMMTPVAGSESVRERLILEGKLIERKHPPDVSKIKRVPPKPGVPLPSELLQMDREDRV